MNVLLKGECSFSQKRGLIKLLHKKGDRNKLNNYRPISLLNYDYKICTLALAIRLQSVIGNIIGEEQTGYIKGRYIGQNVRLIEDVIDYCSTAQITTRKVQFYLWISKKHLIL